MLYDGGLRHNFPDMLDIVVEGDEREIVDRHRRNVVVIDTTPVGTVDFGMSNDDKTFLLAIGRAAALKFLEDRRLDDGPASDVVERARKEAENLRQLAIEGRRLRRKYRHIRRLTA